MQARNADFDPRQRPLDILRPYPDLITHLLETVDGAKLETETGYDYPGIPRCYSGLYNFTTTIRQITIDLAPFGWVIRPKRNQVRWEAPGTISDNCVLLLYTSGKLDGDCFRLNPKGPATRELIAGQNQLADGGQRSLFGPQDAPPRLQKAFYFISEVERVFDEQEMIEHRYHTPHLVFPSRISGDGSTLWFDDIETYATSEIGASRVLPFGQPQATEITPDIEEIEEQSGDEGGTDDGTIG